MVLCVVNFKKKATGQNKDRDRQFKKINKLRKAYNKSKNPIISVDGKKKEKIGNLYREGTVECREAIEVYDHDYPSLAEGEAQLYAIYDLKFNDAMFSINTSYETSEFACDSIKLWWDTVGKKRYPDADTILILADGGGSNSSRRHVFKEALQRISNLIGISIRLAHYPPYTSKWNPIEHRVFPHVTRSLSGIVLSSVELIKELIKKTKTKTGLKVLARITKKVYEKGKKVADDFYDKANLKFDKVLGRWNYVVSPNL